MMAEEHELTVMETEDRYLVKTGRRSKPGIRMTGYWLGDAGFEAGSKVKVTVSPYKVILTPVFSADYALLEELEEDSIGT
jgi:hypothetical protein